MRNLLIPLSDGLNCFFRTYPSKYAGIGGIERYTSRPITNANGTVKCVVSQTALTKEFLLREYISNGLELSAFFDQDFDPACKWSRQSPPLVLVRVSSLTTTTTNYVDSPEARTSSAKKASPSNYLSPPTAPRTESSKLDDSPTTVLASPPPRKTANAPSTTPPAVPTGLIQSDKTRSVLPANTLVASENREAELVSTKTGTLDPSNSPSPPTAPRTELSKLDDRPTTLLASPTPRKTADVPLIAPPFLPTEPIQFDRIGSVLPATTLVDSENREAELVPTKTGTLDQLQESSNGNTAFRPGEPTPTVPVSQVSRAKPSSQVFGLPEIVVLSTDSSLPTGSSSILKPSDSFSTGEKIFSRPNGKKITTPTSLGLLGKPDNHRPTSLPFILTFTKQKFTIVNPSNFFLSDTAEIHRDGSTIITSATRSSISFGNSATVVVHDSSTTSLAVFIVTPLSQVPGLEVTENSTSALPSAVITEGNHSELFLGAQIKTAGVSMFVILGATLFGIVVPWGLLYV